MRLFWRWAWAVALVAVGVVGSFGPARANHTQPIGIRCADFSSQADAQGFLREHPYDPDGIDGPPGPNNDTTGKKGVACEDAPCPCDAKPVTYAPGNDAPTIPTVVPITPGGLTDPFATVPTTAVGGAPAAGTASGSTATSTATTRPAGGSLAAPTRLDRDGALNRYARPALIAVGASFVLSAYALWLRRDRQRQYWPTSRPRWPTEW
jgi:hypothetical protein